MVSDMVSDVVDRVVAAVAHSGGTAQRAAAVDLVTRHDRPPRRYHTTRHLHEMLAEVDRLARLGDRPVPAAVELAIATHDAVYDPSADDNEARSADLATDLLDSWGVETGTVAEVVRLVRLTASHDPDAHDGDGHLLVDADLWILSTPPARYDRYVSDVRAEYAHVDDEQWRRGRRDVLDRLDTRLETVGYLVGPPADREARRDRARANLARERSTLTPVE